MASIQSIVSVSIERATNQATTQDLNTIAILTEHTRFVEDYKIYSSLTEMTEDGFLVGDKAYKYAQAAFSQNPRPPTLVVGKKAALDSYVEAIQELEAAYNQWLFLITDAESDIDAPTGDHLLIAAYIETTEKFYVIHSADADAPTVLGDLGSALKALGYERTFGIYSSNAAIGVPAAGWLGRFAPQQLGSATWIYKPITGITPDNFTTTQLTNLNNKNWNSYTTVEGTPVVFGDNKVFGGEYIDVMLGVQWIITRMRERVWGTLLNSRKVSFDTAGIAKIESDIRSVLAEATDLGILAADFAPVITVPNALSLTSAQRNTRILTGVTFEARLAGAIQKVDGIRGTVFA